MIEIARRNRRSLKVQIKRKLGHKLASTANTDNRIDDEKKKPTGSEEKKPVE
eukprot:SAG11_NODE_2262_length_3608_cov_3.051012_2_plen_52_part_00